MYCISNADLFIVCVAVVCQPTPHWCKMPPALPSTNFSYTNHFFCSPATGSGAFIMSVHLGSTFHLKALFLISIITVVDVQLR